MSPGRQRHRDRFFARMRALRQAKMKKKKETVVVTKRTADRSPTPHPRGGRPREVVLREPPEVVAYAPTDGVSLPAKGKGEGKPKGKPPWQRSQQGGTPGGKGLQKKKYQNLKILNL